MDRGYKKEMKKRFLLAGLFVGGVAAIAVRADRVKISEIMYHPVDATNSPVDGQQYEFIEIHNTSASPTDISGWSFSKSSTITNQFPTNTILGGGAGIWVLRRHR